MEIEIFKERYNEQWFVWIERFEDRKICCSLEHARAYAEGVKAGMIAVTPPIFHRYIKIIENPHEWFEL